MRFLAWSVVVVLIAGTWLIACGAETPGSMLVEHAIVSGPRITLADLLPGTATPTLRVRAVQLDLGRAPQVGTARVLEGDWLRERIRGTEFAAVSVPGKIVVERSAGSQDGIMQGVRAAVREHLNRKVGREWGNRVEVGFPVDPPRVASGASFSVVAEEWDARAHTLQLRLACEPRRDCMPFFVTARFHGSDRDLRQLGTRFIRERRAPPAQALLAETREVAPVRPRKKAAPVLTSAGSQASMTVEAPGLHIFTQVICLERGVAGQIIRVRNVESKRVLRAQVVGAGQVRGPE